MEVGECSLVRLYCLSKRGKTTIKILLRFKGCFLLLTSFTIEFDYFGSISLCLAVRVELNRCDDLLGALHLTSQRSVSIMKHLSEESPLSFSFWRF